MNQANRKPRQTYTAEQKLEYAKLIVRQVDSGRRL